MAVHGLIGPPLLALAGVAVAWVLYLRKPELPAAIQRKIAGLYTVLENKYYFDRFNEIVFAGGARALGNGLWRKGEQGLIDGIGVSGSSRLVSLVSRFTGLFQTGYLYQYAFTMIVGVFVLLTFWVSFG